MSDLHLNLNELDECWDEYLLTLPTVFDECMSAEQQILWILAHKQDLLVEGDNITLTPNEDGTVTISSEGGQGATYRIETATPDEGYTAAYILKNVDTGTQSGVKIQVPTVAGPQGPAGPQGVPGQDGSDGADGVGITSIIFKETDPSGNNVYTVTLTNGNTYDITCPIGPTGATGPQGATGPAGPGVPTGGTVGQVLKKSGSGDYETNWEDMPALPTPGAAAGSYDLRVKSDASGYIITAPSILSMVILSNTTPTFPQTETYGHQLVLQSLGSAQTELDLTVILMRTPSPNGTAISKAILRAAFYGTLTIGTQIPKATSLIPIMSANNVNKIVYIYSNQSVFNNLFTQRRAGDQYNNGYSISVLDVFATTGVVYDSVNNKSYDVMCFIQLTTASSIFVVSIHPLHEAIPVGTYEFIMTK